MQATEPSYQVLQLLEEVSAQWVLLLPPALGTFGLCSILHYIGSSGTFRQLVQHFITNGSLASHTDIAQDCCTLARGSIGTWQKPRQSCKETDRWLGLELHLKIGCVCGWWSNEWKDETAAGQLSPSCRWRGWLVTCSRYRTPTPKLLSDGCRAQLHS